MLVKCVSNSRRSPCPNREKVYFITSVMSRYVGLTIQENLQKASCKLRHNNKREKVDRKSSKNIYEYTGISTILTCIIVCMTKTLLKIKNLKKFYLAFTHLMGKVEFPSMVEVDKYYDSFEPLSTLT